MPLAWDERMRLLRLVGMAEAVLGAAQASRAEELQPGLGEQVDFLLREIRATLAGSDALAAEFERVVMRGPDAELPAELRAAALVGWVKAGLTTEALDEQRADEAAMRPRRKQTIGFRIRSPLTREHAVPDGGTERRES